MTEGVRFPTMAFITGGAGQADDGIPPQPFETFCYDSALLEARIENFNVVPYTSVLPKEMYGNIVPINDDIVKQFKHGAVLEVIMAGYHFTGNTVCRKNITVQCCNNPNFSITDRGDLNGMNIEDVAIDTIGATVQI